MALDRNHTFEFYQRKRNSSFVLRWSW